MAKQEKELVSQDNAQGSEGLYAQALRAGLFQDRRVFVPLEARTQFFNESFISIDQIKSPQQIESLFEMADVLEEINQSGGVYSPLKDYFITELFWENSTRTSLSFEAAAKHLGAHVAVRDGMKVFSSATKGESLEDTIHAGYNVTDSDLIIVRHHKDNSSQRARGIAQQYGIPVINAGSGSKEHPTQALLDLYTIRRIIGRTDRLRVMMVGDLKNGRTNKSLAKLLAIMDPNVEIIFASPEQLRSPQDFIDDLTPKVGSLTETDDFASWLPHVDVVYMTRVQKERFKEDEQDLYEQIKDMFIFTPEHMAMMQEHAILMHPLPRVNEIAYAVDNDPRAAYFKQMRSGLYVRMALLHEILVGHQIVTV
jgi:aspartate carbamoyltransferase catalytic subunit